jgi:hypothetical protein
MDKQRMFGFKRKARRLRSATKQAANSYIAGAPQTLSRLRYLPEIVAGLKLGLKYRRAAVRDEKDGFPFTSAMEWRKAAELFSIIPQISDGCWHEWERITRLPRRLARPIGESVEVSRHCLLFYDSPKFTKTVAKEIPAATAA